MPNDSSVHYVIRRTIVKKIKSHKLDSLLTLTTRKHQIATNLTR